MNQLKLSTILALVAWGSVLVLAWLLALGQVQVTSVSAAAWIFFMFVAVGASAVASPGKHGTLQKIKSRQFGTFDRITLYDDIARDTGMEPGDLIIFSKTEEGLWEVRSRGRLLNEIIEADEMGIWPSGVLDGSEK